MACLATPDLSRGPDDRKAIAVPHMPRLSSQTTLEYDTKYATEWGRAAQDNGVPATAAIAAPDNAVHQRTLVSSPIASPSVAP